MRHAPLAGGRRSAAWRRARDGARPALVLMLAACGDDARSQRNVFEDQGSVCLRTTDGSLGASVRAPATCLSSSCDTEREAACTMRVEGARLLLTSHLAYTSRGGSCTNDCGVLAAQCSTDLPLDGTYSVDLGSKQNILQLTVEGSAIEGSTAGDCGAPF